MSPAHAGLMRVTVAEVRRETVAWLLLESLLYRPRPLLPAPWASSNNSSWCRVSRARELRKSTLWPALQHSGASKKGIAVAAFAVTIIGRPQLGPQKLELGTAPTSAPRFQSGELECALESHCGYLRVR